MTTARLTVLPANGAASVHELIPGRRYRVGRSESADIVLQDDSVSRDHVVIEWSGEGWQITDTDSLNGVFLGGKPIRDARLSADSWLRLGSVYCHFECLEQQSAGAGHAGVSRHNRDRRQRLASHRETGSLARDVLEELVHLLQPDRAYLLLNNGQAEWLVQHAVDADGETLSTSRFGGNALAVQQCMESMQPVIVHDNWPSSQNDARLVATGVGLSAILVFPLLARSELIGVIYADSRQPGASVTELDLELVQALANQAALPLWLARMRMELRALRSEHAGNQQPSAH